MNAQYAAQAHRPFEVTLDESPSTGFLWTLRPHQDFSVQDAYHQPDLPAGHVGGTGKRTFTLTPLRPGTFELAFEQARPWENGPAARTHTLRVTVHPEQTT